jgi:small-conductance mechanosensitive channel
MRKSMLSIAVIAVLGTASLYASSNNMAESLMKLRADVEQLDASITDEKDAYKAQMKSLLRQKNDLESVVGREDLKIKQIQRELTKVKKEIKEAVKNTQGLKPLVLNALDTLESNVKTALPFKTTERLADIEKIRSQLNAGLIAPQKALALTWNAYGDAIRMTKENGIFKQTITIDGTERLAEVARLGTVAMFYKLPDDSVGFVDKDANGWYYKEVIEKEQQKQVLALFDSFRKQIRAGYFTLPNAIAVT